MESSSWVFLFLTLKLIETVSIRRFFIGLPLLGDFQPFAGLEVAFAAKPVFHRILKSFEGNAVSNFEQPVGGWERIVENRVVGKVPHGEVVDLADGASVALTRGINALDGEAAGEHGFTVNERASAG